MNQATTTGYPARITFDAPLEVANWRPLLHWLLAIPHMMVLWFLGLARNVITVIAFFAILFTKKYPEGLFGFMALTIRYQWRVSTYVFFMRETYPPFDFDTSLEDSSGDPAKFSVEYPQELKRFMPLVKWFLLIPHLFVIVFLAIGALFAWIGSFFAVLFTGKYPEGIRNYMVGLSRWVTRVTVYAALMTDVYPPFSMQE